MHNVLPYVDDDIEDLKVPCTESYKSIKTTKS